MIVAVTGATGLVGSHVVRALLGQGHVVRVLVRRPERLGILSDVAPQLQITFGSLEDAEALESLLEGAEAAVHAAALVAFHPRWRRRMRQINVRGTALLVDTALRLGIRRLVHISSVAALGIPEGAEALDGTLRAGLLSWPSYYGYTKYLAELEVYRGIAEGLEAVLLNPALVFGPGRIYEGTGRLFRLARRGWLRRYPPGETAVVDARDVAGAVCAALERGGVGRRYVLAAEPRTFRDLFGDIAQVLGRPGPERPFSPRALYVLGLLGELWGWIWPDPVGLSRETARSASRQVRYVSDRAIEELGVRFRPFVETLQDTVAWYRRTGQL
jgi:dihydroflavonol-4-reductase|nr:MAG: dihydroflavonol 4-reductase [Bacteroidota bacterium]